RNERNAEIHEQQHGSREVDANDNILRAGTSNDTTANGDEDVMVVSRGEGESDGVVMVRPELVEEIVTVDSREGLTETARAGPSGRGVRVGDRGGHHDYDGNNHGDGLTEGEGVGENVALKRNIGIDLEDVFEDSVTDENSLNGLSMGESKCETDAVEVEENEETRDTANEQHNIPNVTAAERQLILYEGQPGTNGQHQQPQDPTEDSEVVRSQGDNANMNTGLINESLNASQQITRPIFSQRATLEKWRHYVIGSLIACVNLKGVFYNQLQTSLYGDDEYLNKSPSLCSFIDVLMARLDSLEYLDLCPWGYPKEVDDDYGWLMARRRWDKLVGSQSTWEDYDCKWEPWKLGFEVRDPDGEFRTSTFVNRLVSDVSRQLSKMRVVKLNLSDKAPIIFPFSVFENFANLKVLVVLLHDQTKKTHECRLIQEVLMNLPPLLETLKMTIRHKQCAGYRLLQRVEFPSLAGLHTFELHVTRDSTDNYNVTRREEEEATHRNEFISGFIKLFARFDNTLRQVLFKSTLVTTVYEFDKDHFIDQNLLTIIASVIHYDVTFPSAIKILESESSRTLLDLGRIGRPFLHPDFFKHLRHLQFRGMDTEYVEVLEKARLPSTINKMMILEALINAANNGSLDTTVFENIKSISCPDVNETFKSYTLKLDGFVEHCDNVKYLDFCIDKSNPDSAKDVVSIVKANCRYLRFVRVRLRRFDGVGLALKKVLSVRDEHNVDEYVEEDAVGDEVNVDEDVDGHSADVGGVENEVMMEVAMGLPNTVECLRVNMDDRKLGTEWMRVLEDRDITLCWAMDDPFVLVHYPLSVLKDGEV
ncbi:hypothetical protein HDU76_004144, partial [Blyttiomyces sp. JEL0837]